MSLSRILCVSCLISFLIHLFCYQADKSNNGPSEFADVWKELKLKEGSDTAASADSTPAQKTEDALIKVNRVRINLAGAPGQPGQSVCCQDASFSPPPPPPPLRRGLMEH